MIQHIALYGWVYFIPSNKTHKIDKIQLINIPYYIY